MQAVSRLQRTNQDKFKHVHQPISVGIVQVRLDFFLLHVPHLIILLTLVLLSNMKAITYYPYTPTTCLLFQFVASS